MKSQIKRKISMLLWPGNLMRSKTWKSSIRGSLILWLIEKMKRESFRQLIPKISKLHIWWTQVNLILVTLSKMNKLKMGMPNPKSLEISLKTRQCSWRLSRLNLYTMTSLVTFLPINNINRTWEDKELIRELRSLEKSSVMFGLLEMPSLTRKLLMKLRRGK